jgi:hypothetical protein
MKIMLCYALNDLCSAGIVLPRSKGYAFHSGGESRLERKRDIW